MRQPQFVARRVGHARCVVNLSELLRVQGGY